jgi:hypothetical protein
MRSIERWLTSTLMAALVFAGAAVAQPERKVGLPPLPGEPGRLGADDVVERIMAFDKNKDGKVTKDELAERMHNLITRGDANKDGALDKNEIKKLATAPGGFGFGGRGEIRIDGPGPGGPFLSRSIVAGPAPGPGFPGPGAIDGVIDDLKLSGKKKDQALAAVKAHEENVRKVLDQSRAELLQTMKQILSEEELQDFKAALDRPRGGAAFFSVGPPDGPGFRVIEKKFEQFQKELDDLRRPKR